MQTAALARGDACFDNIEALDRELARTARKSGPLRLAMGLGLEALARGSGHARLGFTSIEDYGRERCERGPTCISQSRRLARRTSALPRLRAALFSGRINWSMAQTLARVATPETEELLLQLAAGHTVSHI